MLINIADPSSNKTLYFFDYTDAAHQMRAAMIQEMLEAEGEDSGDEEDFAAIQANKPVTPQEIISIQDLCKSNLQLLWDEILRSSEVDKSTIITILKAMNTKIFPKVAKPILFSDFIISAYDLIDDVSSNSKLSHKDITLSIHALSSLFILLSNHGLDYTSINFYQKLYSLLDHLPNIFRMKEKEKFFRLLELSLKSPMLPSTIAASFVKKCCRIIISEHIAQSSTCIWVISFVCNIIKKHPVCTKMINVDIVQRSNRLQRIENRKLNKRDQKLAKKKQANPSLMGFIKKDAFDINEKDPMKTNALDTCLWEVLAFLNHSFKIVRDYASILCTDFQHKKSLPSEELAKLSEDQLINSQLEDISKIKSVKPKEIERIEGIYANYDVEGEIKFEARKERFVEEQIELFHPKHSLLTFKF